MEFQTDARGPRDFHQEQLVKGLCELYETGLLTDIILVAGDTEIAAHRNVLAASSPYFRAMLTNDVIETTQERVHLHEVDPFALQVIIDFMYKGDIDINNSNVQNLFTTASLFEMLGLCELCAEHMVQQLHVSNCVSLYQFGSFHHCQKLKETARLFVINHFCNVAKSEEILGLSVEDFLELLQEDSLNVKQEETVFESIVAWVNHNPAERHASLSKLLQHVRFTLMSMKYLTEVVEHNELVLKDGFCKGLLSMGKLYKATRESIDEENEGDYSTELSLNVRPRLGMYNRPMMVFMGGGQNEDSRGLTCYDPVTKKNYYAIPLHVSFDFKYRVDYHRAVVTDKNEIYLIGGIFYDEHHFELAGNSLREVKLFDPYKKEWHDRCPLLYRRCAHTAVYCKGQIIAIGGKASYPAGSPTASVEVYNSELDTWTYKSSMPLKLCHHSACVWQDKVFVIGGVTLNNVVTKTFLQYDVTADVWTALSNTMQIPRSEFGAAVLGDDLYVVGGTNGHFKVSSMEIYNCATERWRFGVDFPEDRKSMVTVTFNGCLYIGGGVRTLISRINRTPRVVETKDLWKYDPGRQAWNREAKLVQYANVHACVVAEMNTRRLYESEFISAP